MSSQLNPPADDQVEPTAAAPTPDPQALANALTWNRLSGQRWGPGTRAPGIEIPAGGWRWEVACWPIDRWLVWNRRVTELTPTGADVAAIEAAQRQAYDELHDPDGASAP